MWEDGEAAWDLFMQRYFLACAHVIWKLLPQDASRKGIEVTERYILGRASDEEFSNAEHEAEGAAFNIDYNGSPGDIKKWINDIKRIPHEELCKMIHPNEAIEYYKPKELLKYAAYFAHFAMTYPNYNSYSKVLDLIGRKWTKTRWVRLKSQLNLDEYIKIESINDVDAFHVPFEY